MVPSGLKYVSGQGIRAKRFLISVTQIIGRGDGHGYGGYHGLPHFHIDAFTQRPFSGNPANVVILNDACEDTWMQNLATENNAPVTAYVRPEASGSYNIRWFTPTKEIEICGHATLAAAHVMFTSKLVPSSRIDFTNKFAGRFSASLNDDSAITILLPTDAPQSVQLTTTDMQLLMQVFGIRQREQMVYVGRNKMDLIIELRPADFQSVPRHQLIASLGGRGVVICCTGGSSHYLHRGFSDLNSRKPGNIDEIDFFLRGFFPNIGLNEDYVTGSALCALTPHFYNQYSLSNDPDPSFVGLRAFQTSSRGGSSIVRLAPSGASNFVSITAHCVTTAVSTILSH